MKSFEVEQKHFEQLYSVGAAVEVCRDGAFAVGDEIEFIERGEDGAIGRTMVRRVSQVLRCVAGLSQGYVALALEAASRGSNPGKRIQR